MGRSSNLMRSVLARSKPIRDRSPEFDLIDFIIEFECGVPPDLLQSHTAKQLNRLKKEHEAHLKHCQNLCHGIAKQYWNAEKVPAWND
jgi:hypothetical protein